jgi:hypothetical protein
VVRHPGPAVLYDLTVERHHLYLAAGLVVSNSDGLGYILWAREATAITQARHEGTIDRNRGIANPYYGVLRGAA